VYVWLAKPELLLLCTLWGLNLEESLGAWQRTNFRAALAFLLSYTPLRAVSGRYLERAAASAPGTQAEIDALRVEAIVWINQGSWARAGASATRAVACARASRDDLSLMHCLLQLQLAKVGLDDYGEVAAIGREIEALAARTQNPRYTAMALVGQGAAWVVLGDLAQAEAALERAGQSLDQQLGPLPEALQAGYSALCALRQGRHARALAMARKAMDAVQRARWAMVELRNALLCILEVYLAGDGHGRHALEIEAALAALHRIGRAFPVAEPTAWLFQGRYEHARGRPARAARSLRRSLRACERLGSRYERTLAHYWLGRLAQSPAGRRHVPEGAALHLCEALVLAERLGFAWEATSARAALQRWTALG
jgi:tetratricopeptide (TPR) repeat protein